MISNELLNNKISYYINMITNNRTSQIFQSSVAIFLISWTASLYLSETSAQEDISTETGSKLTGTNLDLLTSSPLPFNQTADNDMTLSFMPKAKETEGTSFTPGKIDHLDYEISITKDGNMIWSKQFHDHDGNLRLQFHPSTSESILVSGGDEDPGRSTTSPYTVEGSIFVQDGSYDISAKIVGIEFNPLPSPISDNFNVQVVS